MNTDITVPEPKEPRLTKKQRMFLQEYIKTGNGTKAALMAYDTDDYAVAAAIASENLKLLKQPIKTYLEANGLTFKHLMGTLVGGLGAKKIHSSHTEPDKEIDDWAVRHKYLETAGKWLGISTDEARILQQINVEQPIPLLGAEPSPVLVKFIENQKDRESQTSIDVERMSDEELEKLAEESERS